MTVNNRPSIENAVRSLLNVNMGLKEKGCTPLPGH
jgi:hypothetical protein